VRIVSAVGEAAVGEAAVAERVRARSGSCFRLVMNCFLAQVERGQMLLLWNRRGSISIQGAMF
jgi:hypothetical protein